MVIQQQASCSADAITNISVLLFIVFLLKFRFQEKVNWRNLLVLLALAVLMAVSKYAYAPLILLSLILLPKLHNKHLRVGIIVGTIVLIIAGFLYILLAYQGDFSPSIDLLKNPLDSLIVISRTIYQFGQYYILSFSGGYLGALNIYTWEPLILCYLGIILASVFNSLDEPVSFKFSEKVFTFALVIFVALLIVVVFRGFSIQAHDTWDVILGTQGRYFIPIFILLFLSGINSKAYIKRPNCLLFYAPACATVLVGCLVQVVGAAL
jgi:uncharacterized membrane protein